MKTLLKSLICFTLVSFFMLSSAPISYAQKWTSTKVLLKNKYRKNSFIKVENDKLSTGSIDGNSSTGRWVIEFVQNTEFFRIKKEGTDKYLHLENESLECSNVPAGYWTSHWKRIKAGNGFYRIENRYRKGQVLNMEKGPLEASGVPAGYWTSHWEFQPAYLPLVIHVDNNSDDVVESMSEQPNLPHYSIRFSLSTAKSVKDWKGLKVFNKEGQEVCLLQTIGDNHEPTTSRNFNPGEFGSKIKVEFWKAKAFGVNTHVGTTYLNNHSDELRGMEILYKWMDE
ncbi:MAG: RICIN domain-containing protein [Bacteroidetes bacterium]|nr:RICIN domain-containing protein [Bacteroidota bacterium]